MNEEKILWLFGLFAFAAVGAILYQHALHTGQIVGTLKSVSPPSTDQQLALPSPASLAGTPALTGGGVSHMTAVSPPINSGANWRVS